MLGALRSLKGSRPGVYEAARRIKHLLEEGDREAAVEQLLDALERWPGHSSLEDIKHFLGQKRLQDSLSEVNRLEDQALKAHVRAARAFADTDNHEQAASFVSTALRRFPDCPELHLTLGEVHLRRYLADRIPEDGRRAAAEFERTLQLDRKNPLPLKYLAGLHARTGCFHQAADDLALLDGAATDDDERRYVEELRTYCAGRADTEHERDFEHGLSEVWERGEFLMDCRDWAAPRPPVFGRRDMKSILAPIVMLESIARGCVDLPGVAAVVIQNAVRSETVTTGADAVNVPSLEKLVREIVGAAGDACARMTLGRVKAAEVKTSLGRLVLHMFSDTWVGLLFAGAVSGTQVRTVTQQFLDRVAEQIGESHENRA
ncbi:MAG TPA: hypothetical protein VMX57_09555 [Planctomycetota bacterium]|nr:hypothetical protein [Planctomycetota bacterium]